MKKSIKKLIKGLTPKYQQFTMTDWAAQSVIFMSNTAQKLPENEARLPKRDSQLYAGGYQGVKTAQDYFDKEDY